MPMTSRCCVKCHHEWIPRIENPVKCPFCGHRLAARIYKKREGCV